MSEIFNLSEVFETERTQLVMPDGERIGELGKMSDFKGKKGLRVRRYWNVINAYTESITLPTAQENNLLDQAYGEILSIIVLDAAPNRVRTLPEPLQEMIFNRFMEETKADRDEGAVGESPTPVTGAEA